mgnify:CR=1 FL=1
MKDTLFFHQAELLLQVLPYFRSEKDLALKGGTAINFFINDLPRLSVDIDLCYLQVLGREESLQNITNAIGRVSETIQIHYPNSQIDPRVNHRDGVQYGFNIELNDVSIKVETNYVIRGSVHPPVERELSKGCQELFNTATRIQTLSREDLYGGKICAALDRQHPRDLFDIKVLFEGEGEGISEDIRKTFIVYLISSPRPIVELLDPQIKDISALFDQEFQDMTREEVTLRELEDARKKLVEWVRSELTVTERSFLMSFKEGLPKWDLLEYKHIPDLPAVRWKLRNIETMPKAKHTAAVKKLERYLSS